MYYICNNANSKNDYKKYILSRIGLCKKRLVIPGSKPTYQIGGHKVGSVANLKSLICAVLAIFDPLLNWFEKVPPWCVTRKFS